MRTFTQLTNFATNLTGNTSTANSTLMGQLINDQHRYLLQKYFNNEKTSQTTTVGGQSLTLTGVAAINAVSATLTAVWAYPTVTQFVNFSNTNQRSVLFTNGSAAITWVGGLTSAATTAITTVGVQRYAIPANISKIKDVTVNVGQTKYVPTEVMTRVEWDRINFLPYASDIPNYYFVYNNNIELFPIPSTTGNIITYNYKTRVADLTYADYTTPGTISTMAVGGTAVVGTATTWASSFPAATDLSYTNLAISVSPKGGDGIWYPIASVTDNTNLVLVNPVINAPNASGASMTIGQLPLLSEDFQDMMVYGSLMIYFSSIKKDDASYKKFENEYNKRLELLEEYAGTKSIQVDLGQDPPMVNPNLFIIGN